MGVPTRSSVPAAQLPDDPTGDANDPAPRHPRHDDGRALRQHRLMMPSLALIRGRFARRDRFLPLRSPTSPVSSRFEDDGSTCTAPLMSHENFEHSHERRVQVQCRRQRLAGLERREGFQSSPALRLVRFHPLCDCAVRDDIDSPRSVAQTATADSFSKAGSIRRPASAWELIAPRRAKSYVNWDFGRERDARQKRRKRERLFTTNLSDGSIVLVSLRSTVRPAAMARELSISCRRQPSCLRLA